MIDIPPALQAKLDAGATTLAWCWRVTRSDGAVYGFTDHDRALTHAGQVFEPDSGVSPGGLRGQTGLAPARGAAFGAVSSQRIDEADLDNGLWDGARVEIFRVDWSEPALGFRTFTGELGEITRSDGGFEAELSGRSVRLSRTIGRVYASRCDAALGGARCSVDLTDPAYRAHGVVTASPHARAVVASGLESFSNGWFADGSITWTSGANMGASSLVTIHRAASGGALLELSPSPAAAISAGDEFTVTAGCDKRLDTCASKFANAVNFRGCPFMPGNDVLVRHAGEMTARG